MSRLVLLPWVSATRGWADVVPEVDFQNKFTAYT